MHKSVRILSLDIARGIFILLMLVGHSIFFFHAGTNTLLSLINGAADMFAFVGLLLVSGAAAYVSYVHDNHPTGSLSKRVFKRIAMYYVGYVLLASIGTLAYESLSPATIIEIALFAKLVPFTEFIIPFLILGISVLPLRRLYHKVANSEGVLLAAIGISMVLQTLGAELLVSYLPPVYESILFGAEGYYAFSLFAYLPIYLVGLYLGRELYNHEPKDRLVHELTLGSLVLTLVGFAFVLWWPDLGQSITRFPPSPAFLALSLSGAILILRVVLSFRNLLHMPVTRTALLLFGQNTFAILVTHTILLFAYAYLSLPQFQSAILTTILFFISTYIALYFAKILPLNYKAGLTLVNLCECELIECKHAKEHRYVARLKRILFKIFSPDAILSISRGHTKQRLVKGWAPIIAGALLLLAATPVGFAENNALLRQQLSTVSGSVNRTWILTTDQSAVLRYTISLPESVLDQDTKVTYSLSTGDVGILMKKDTKWTADISLERLPVGQHTITTHVQQFGTEYNSQPTIFNISHPLYITWTIDWEGYDVKDEYLSAMDTISSSFNVPMVHLFNPRLFTSPEITEERVDRLTEWVRERNRIHNEEIGLHLHMFPDYIASSGVTPKNEPVWGGGFTPGYDILTTTYTDNELTQILQKAISDFQERDLGTPKSYRAGGWFADSATLQALENNGFTVDTSGRTAYQFGTNNVDGPWELSATQQPYFPSKQNQNSTNPPPRFSVLEIPNNGGDSYWFSAEDMITRFDNIYQKEPLKEHKQVTYLSHPEWFDSIKQEKMRAVFDHVSKYSYAQDLGPVVFVDLQTIYRAWNTK